MKITSKQYATSLYETILDKKEGELKGVIENFVKIIIANNDLSKADSVISEFSKLWNKEKGVIEAEVLSAVKLDKETVDILSDYISNITKSKNVSIETETDKKLIGGVIIKYGDKILDGSLKTRLKDFKNKLVK